MNNYTVYMHVAPNDKKYIGITCLNPIKRWSNGNGYKHNDYFNRAIKKYGWENIEHKIIYANLSKEEAERKEIELIKYFKTNKKNNGYNIQNGGNSKGKLNQEQIEKLRQANLGKFVSEETREKMRRANLGKKASLETREKMSRNNPRFWKNKHHSDETKEKLRQINLGKKLSDEQKLKISNSLKGHRSWNKGLKLKKRSDEIRKKTSKSIICVETGIVYFGIREAERQTGIRHEYICKCCEGKGKTANGFHWRYYNG